MSQYQIIGQMWSGLAGLLLGLFIVDSAFGYTNQQPRSSIARPVLYASFQSSDPVDQEDPAERSVVMDNPNDTKAASPSSRHQSDNQEGVNYLFSFMMQYGSIVRPLVIILGIGILVVVLKWSIRKSSDKIVQFLTQHSDDSGKDHANRIKTLNGVFLHTMTTTIYIGALLMILSQLGVDITVLLGGVAVIGLAVAFGAQNLIRDFFYGFVILLENQYAVNDVIQIGEITGSVERVTLRTTILRDLHGCVHFIPNGEITRVSNMTHGWARAVIEVGVAYTEDLDHVMSVLMDLANAFRDDPEYRDKILDDPTMLGVDSLGESAVIIKFFLKTKTHQQGSIKREMQRRIKKRFDELRIEIPYPHQVIFHQEITETREN